MKFSVSFFVRNNNDIDHFVPVAWKCAQNKIYVKLIITTHHAYRRDDRIIFLAKNDHVKVYHLFDFLNISTIEKVKILNNTLKGKSPNEINTPCVWSHYFDDLFFDNLIKNVCFDIENCVVCFDSSVPFYIKLSTKLQYYGIPRVSLPHGAGTFVNSFISKDMIKPNIVNNFGTESDTYDYRVVANKHGVRNAAKFNQKPKIMILGSPRFCREWRETYFKTCSTYIEFGRYAQLKVAFFLRDWGYAINWEEVERTFRLITQFPEVHLTVKHHPRAIAQKQLKQKYPYLFIEKSINLTILTDQGNSHSVIDWADIVIECGTGMGLEAIIQNKPVLSLEYLHPNRTIYAEYIKNCDIQTRDQLYEWIVTFLKDKNFNFYDDSKEKFLSEMIENNNSDVLNDYVYFLSSIARRA